MALYKRFNSFITILFITFAIDVYANIELKIDSVYYEFKKIDLTNLLYIKAFWSICNNDEDTIYNIDSLWYFYPGYFIKKEGVGNTNIKLIQKNSTSLGFHLWAPYLEIDFDECISYTRLNLLPDRCIKGVLNGWFDVIKSDIKDTCWLQIEYDTRFQKDGGKPLWRGRLFSDKVPIKIKISDGESGKIKQ